MSFPAIPSLPLNFGIPHHVVENFAVLPNCLSRALCAVAFAEAAQGDDEFYSLLSDAKYEVHLRNAYMRAALGEFVSIEKMLSKDLYNAGIEFHPKGIYASQIWLPIIFKELRNLNFHIASAGTEEKESAVSVRFKPSDAEVLSLTLPIRTIVFDEGDFLRLKNVDASRKGRSNTFWRNNDALLILSWFNEKQKYAGAHRLLVRAVVDYLEFLIDEYQLTVQRA